MNIQGSNWKAGVCMLLLLSTLFLWEHVASNPSGVVSTEALYNHVVEQAQATNVLAANMQRDVDIKFLQRSIFSNKVCHTASINAPESHQEVHNTKIEDLLKSVVIITHAWVEPLINLVSAVPTLQGASDNLLRTANAVKEGNNILREGLQPILNRTQVVVEDDDYPDWSGQSDLQSSDEDIRRFAFYNLTNCLKGDMQKISDYLEDLRCRATIRNHYCT